MNGKMLLNDAGRMVDNEWINLPCRFSNIKLNKYIIMPNHFHVILEIIPMISIVGAPLVGALNVITNQNGDDKNGGVINGDDKNGDVINGNDNINNDKHSPQNHCVPQNRNFIDNENQEGQPQGIAPGFKTLGEMIGAFQSVVTVKYIRGVKIQKWRPFNKKLWQRNYWEHIIRNKFELNRIRKYIENNPQNWQNDKLHGGRRNRVMENHAEYEEEIWMC